MKRETGAALSSEARKTFFRLFLPLLDFVNQKTGLSEVLSDQMRMGHPELKELKKVADALWKDPAVIEEYIETIQETTGLSKEDRQLLESWKHPVSSTFILERHLSMGSIFIDLETEKVYQVKGISDPWKDMLYDLKPPFPIAATLIPFRDVIISDGLVAPHLVSFGPDYQENFMQIYAKAKNSGSIIKKL